MKAVVIFAHPDPSSSFEAAARDAVVRGLRRRGATVEVLDLYALGFVAAMTRAERLAYITDQPILDPMVAAHAASVRGAHTVVFVYRTVNWGVPAMLKGWFERVLVSGVAFTLDEKSGRFRPGLKQMRRIIGVSTYTASAGEMRFFNDAGRRIICRGLRLSAPRARTQWHGLYEIDQSGPEASKKRCGFLEHLETAMAKR